jgi:bifunctional DNase/RNase
MTPTRPLTHDLFKSFAQSFSIQVKEVVIYNLNEGIFYAKLICEREGLITEIDARTSDAIAIGIRFNAIIYTFESILSNAGVLLDENEFEVPKLDEEEKDELVTNSFLNLSIEELTAQLNEALENEAYEIASKIRDEINKRTSK